MLTQSAALIPSLDSRDVPLRRLKANCLLRRRQQLLPRHMPGMAANRLHADQAPDPPRHMHPQHYQVHSWCSKVVFLPLQTDCFRQLGSSRPAAKPVPEVINRKLQSAHSILGGGTKVICRKRMQSCMQNCMQYCQHGSTISLRRFLSWGCATMSLLALCVGYGVRRSQLGNAQCRAAWLKKVET